MHRRLVHHLDDPVARVKGYAFVCIGYIYNTYITCINTCVGDLSINSMILSSSFYAFVL